MVSSGGALHEMLCAPPTPRWQQVQRGLHGAADLDRTRRGQPPLGQPVLLHDPVGEQPRAAAAGREGSARGGDGGGTRAIQERPALHPGAMWVPPPTSLILWPSRARGLWWKLRHPSPLHALARRAFCNPSAHWETPDPRYRCESWTIIHLLHAEPSYNSLWNFPK